VVVAGEVGSGSYYSHDHFGCAATWRVGADEGSGRDARTHADDSELGTTSCDIHRSKETSKHWNLANKKVAHSK